MNLASTNYKRTTTSETVDANKYTCVDSSSNPYIVIFLVGDPGSEEAMLCNLCYLPSGDLVEINKTKQNKKNSISLVSARQKTLVASFFSCRRVELVDTNCCNDNMK